MYGYIAIIMGSCKNSCIYYPDTCDGDSHMYYPDKCFESITDVAHDAICRLEDILKQEYCISNADNIIMLLGDSWYDKRKEIEKALIRYNNYTLFTKELNLNKICCFQTIEIRILPMLVVEECGRP